MSDLKLLERRITYNDGRAPLVAGQPEVQKYRAQGRENNERVGAFSAVVSVVTVP